MNRHKNILASILIVDDMPKNIQILGNILTESNYLVEFATNGNDALEWLKSRRFDLILLDVMMPGMNGFDVCKKIKENSETQEIPVIFITAKTDPKDITYGFNLGAIDYITKPFNAEELLARVTTHLKVQSQKKELLFQNSFKSILMSVIAHDLRTPLSVISNMANVAKTKKDHNKINELSEAIEIIDNSIKEAFTIVNDLLIWGKVQYGKINAKHTAINLFVLINEISLAFASILGEKRLIINNEIEPNISIITDKDLLKIVLRNLFANAIKFSSFGGKINVSYIISNDDSFAISVSDSGVGIHKEKLKQLFSIEKKIMSSKTFSETGMGLGLFLCNDIIDFLEGSISVESEENIGSTFYVNLPVNPTLNL
jgi:signal transduction histidine kinase